MNFFGWKRAISFVFAALATLEIVAAPAQNVQTVTVAPGQSVTINSKGEVQTQGAPQGQGQGQAQGQPAAQPQGQSQAQPQGQGGGQFTPQQLDELLAPIALYPDALLGQVLGASENPQEVIDAGNWMGLKENQGLKGDALDKATKKAGFSPPMQSLLHFPDVVDMMANQIDWTRQLGQAMKADQKAVLASVQRLRDQAVAAGSLKSNDKQTVETKQEGNTTVVVVQPANPQVIYVPQYDPQKVYTPPPEKKEEDEGVSEETAVMASLLSFGVGMAVGAAAWGGGCCYPSWGYGGVYYGRSVYVAPVYRPAYGGAWGHSNAYHRSGYYANNQNRLTVNNNYYYNRFNNNQNLQNRANTNAANRTGARASASPGAGTNRQPPTREQAQAAAQGRQNERQAAGGTGGAAPSGDRAANAQAQRQSAAASTGSTAPSGDRLANAQAQRQSAGGTTGGTTTSGDRLASAQAQRQSAGGSSGGTSPSGGNAASRMPASDRPSTATPSGDRGFSGGSSGSGAFGGGGSSGRAASASSSRGRSSMRSGRGGGGRRGR
jgi:hypothetical protein